MTSKIEKPVSEDHCENCRFWRQGAGYTPDGVAVGECHRHPPAVTPGARHRGFPVLAGDEWCGEYEKAPEKPGKKPEPEKPEPGKPADEKKPGKPEPEATPAATHERKR